ncbi:MAG: hypothetical protein ACYS3S_04160, partial [Planctomycetota bacterium]
RHSLFVILFCFTTAWGQSNKREPHIGYLYPGGGQQGSVIQITAGGQYLNGAQDVYISGKGVTGSVVKYIRPLRNIQRQQRQLIQTKLKEVRDMRLNELPGSRSRSGKERSAKKVADKPAPAEKEKDDKAEEVKMPDHPLLYDMENKSLRELAHISSVLFFPRNKLQMNRQLAEMVLIEIKIDPDAEPGSHELRLVTKTGLTNPMVFQVGTLPEIRELEPNNRQAYQIPPNMARIRNLPRERALTLPVQLNGQIMPGDVDRFRFRAIKGQQLVIEVQARSLIPYLADAVPGWFQATLALYDARGREVAFADDYRFNPDPVLFYKIPENGDYELEIRDSIYRGREDFVYRIAVSEQPFITQTYPLGGRAGVETLATVDGWNLTENSLPLDTSPGGNSIRRTCFGEEKHRVLDGSLKAEGFGDGRSDKNHPQAALVAATHHEVQQVSNLITYAVDALPECKEKESNNTLELAQLIELPKIINGRISEKDDVDMFRFDGRAGDNIVAEVYARRLNSPLDSLLRLTDSSGNILKWNDDHVLKDSHLHKDVMGLITHHADSYLMTELPKDGNYYIRLTDTQHHGGGAYSYRLRVALAQCDFALRVTPSSLGMRAGSTVPIRVHALRKDGFDGEIEVLLKEAPAGFKLCGGRIPAGRDRVRVTLTVPLKVPDTPVALQLEGCANVGGHTIKRLAVPADDVMQAFLYRHLVPAQEFLLFIQKSKWGQPQVELAGDSPVRIPEGGSIKVQFKAAKRANFKGVQLQLNEPPEGLTLKNVAVVPNGISFQLKADKDAGQIADNLIVEAFREYAVKNKAGKPTGQKRRNLMGVLPAIPIEIVQQ